MFLLDPKAPWEPGLLDAQSGDATNINRFRKEIGLEATTSSFKTPDHLASLVTAAVFNALNGNCRRPAREFQPP